MTKIGLLSANQSAYWIANQSTLNFYQYLFWFIISCLFNNAFIFGQIKKMKIGYIHLKDKTYCTASGTGGPIVLWERWMFVISISSSGNSERTDTLFFSSANGWYCRINSSKSNGSTTFWNVIYNEKQNFQSFSCS